MAICPPLLAPETGLSRWDHDWDQAVRQAQVSRCSVVMASMPLS
jgi:hypothetical protein